jgi:hypothetical protein
MPSGRAAPPDAAYSGPPGTVLFVSAHLDRPLRLGEVLAEAIRIYGARPWAALGVGAFVGAMLLLGALTGHIVGFVAAISVAFTLAFGVSARLVSGDGFREAWAQTIVRSPVLLPLTVVVALPFTLGRIDPLLLLFAVAWLAVSGFSIPVAMLERSPGGDSWFQRLGFSLQRSLHLSRTEYLHALGVAATLVMIYVFFGQLLVALLHGFADNGGLAATALVQIVLAPFFFLGLSVLYFEQKARAVSSPGRG